MSKTAYNISLKGYVGGSDFDRKTVDTTLASARKTSISTVRRTS